MISEKKKNVSEEECVQGTDSSVYATQNECVSGNEHTAQNNEIKRKRKDTMPLRHLTHYIQ